MKTNTNRFENTIFIGMDVHKESISLCCYTPHDDRCWGHTKIDAKFELVLKYILNISEVYGLKGRKRLEIVCGYEAGCTGFSLQRYLNQYNIPCFIMAPSTMAVSPKSRKQKNDRRDSEVIARCLGHNAYKPVFTPTEKDEEIKQFVRMREDQQKLAKSIKQEINAFCLRLGKRYEGGKNRWTQNHFKWLHDLKLSEINRETLNEYLLTLGHLLETLKRLEKRIEEFAQLDEYRDNVRSLCCFLGVNVYTALSIIVEIGDFNRFGCADNFAAYIGLVPGEHSSSNNVNRLGITKAGNAHVRRLLVESAQSYGRGRVGQKSAALKKRQEGCDAKDIAYADRCNERLRRKYYQLQARGKMINVTKTAIARELACFIWGMVTKHHEPHDSNNKDYSPKTDIVVKQQSRGEPFSLLSKKKVSPEPPSQKKPRGASKRK